METLTKEDLISELSNFVGTECWYRHPFQKEFLLTDGVKYFADRTQSYWLLDVIATEYFSLLKDQPFMVITVKAENAACVIVVTDGNENQIQLKDIPFTTLTDGLWKFYLTDSVILLPSEY